MPGMQFTGAVTADMGGTVAQLPAAPARERILLLVDDEANEPGITKVNWGADGSVMLD